MYYVNFPVYNIILNCFTSVTCKCTSYTYEASFVLFCQYMITALLNLALIFVVY